MTRLSFDISDSKQFFQKLLDDCADYSKDKTSSRLAINCAMTAWHLTDWVYHEYEFEKYPSQSKFQGYIRSKCPPLQVMHDITNGTKHAKLERHIPMIRSTELHVGEFNNEFDRSVDISMLVIHMKDGTKKYFQDELNLAIEFWRAYLDGTIKI